MHPADINAISAFDLQTFRGAGVDHADGCSRIQKEGERLGALVRGHLQPQESVAKVEGDFGRWGSENLFAPKQDQHYAEQTPHSVSPLADGVPFSKVCNFPMIYYRV